MSGSHADAPADGARGRVREGLRRLVARGGAPPPGDAPADERTRWRNALLDEVGSDARPLVELLLRVEAHGVVAQLPRGPLAPAAWGPVRARLAFQYAAETYLDAEMARWAVDAWAYAAGTIEAAGLYVAPPAAPLPGAVSAPTPRVIPSAAPTAAAYVPPGAAAARPAVPAKLPGRVRRAMARANAPPPPNPFPQNFDRIAGLTFMGMVTVAAVAMWFGIVDRREAGGVEAAGADVGAPALPGVGAPAPPARAAVRPSDAAATDGGLTVDSLRLRDGTVRTGLVERLVPGAIVLRDPWSDGATRLELGDVVEWRPRRGAVLPVGAEPEAPDPAASVAPTARTSGGAEARIAGVAGRYEVRRRVLDVRGSESCGAVADAVRAAAATVETVEHRPGEATFALASRNGLRGIVDEDGRFRTEPLEGESRGVHYRFRMVGQFVPGGFRAETENETRAVLRWGDVQECHLSVALRADRLP